MKPAKKSDKRENIQDDLAEVYSDTCLHLTVAKIIKAHLSNSKDIRKIALQSIDLDKALNILDVGCGFGYFTEGLVGLIPSGAEVTGVDIHGSNEKHYLEKCKQAGFNGKFDGRGISSINQFDNRSFDLIISSYSLYFFPDYIDKISNLLKKNGYFVVITHAVPHMFELTSFIKEILITEGIGAHGELPYESLILNFSSENGLKLLSQWFSQVKRFKYKSTLVFKDGDYNNLMKYLKFKETFFLTENDFNREHLIRIIADRINNEMKKRGQFNITKDDCIFICSAPK